MVHRNDSHRGDHSEYERAAAALIYVFANMKDVQHISSGGLPAWIAGPGGAEQVHSFVQEASAKLGSGAAFTMDAVLKSDLQAMLEKCALSDAAAAVVTSTMSRDDSPADRMSKLYNLACVRFRGQNYKLAAPLFDEVPKTGGSQTASWTAGTKYLLALCNLKLGDAATAAKGMSEIVTVYPDTEYAEWAARHLRKLQTDVQITKAGGQTK